MFIPQRKQNSRPIFHFDEGSDEPSHSRSPSPESPGKFSHSRPIAVPNSRHSEHLRPSSHAGNDDRYGTSYKAAGPSPLEFQTRRRPSISFDSRVRKDDGNFTGLREEAPSGAEAKPKWTPKRRGSNASSSGNAPIRMLRNAFEEGHAIAEHEDNSMPSLASNSTLSMQYSEARTPPQHGNFFPTKARSVADVGMNDEEDLSWLPMSRHKSFDQKTGRRRRPRRTLTDRSVHGDSLSPASMFLSSWGSLNPATPAELAPDADGKEIGEYTIGKQLGFGGFSVVKEAATYRHGKEAKMAVKIVLKPQNPSSNESTEESEQDDQKQAEFQHEVDIWRCLHNPHILRLHEVYDTNEAKYCFMDLATGGTLHSLVKHNGKAALSAELAQRYSFQLALALRYLHEDVRIIHRDVKLENCLLEREDPSDPDSPWKLLLADFGLAEYIHGSISDDEHTNSPYDVSTRSRSTNLCELQGSVEYTAPELLKACSNPKLADFDGLNSPISTGLDMWAFGICVFVMHVGRLPFRASSAPRLKLVIEKGEWSEEEFLDSQAVKVDRERGLMALEVVRGCLDTRPGRRWDIRRVLESRWFEQLAKEHGGI
ncbi:kinase-like protein [Ascobolus immersus RN42]|uniref:Kinase-like protein n=1 Tax=Ascobolus immersus RN42 TaxID=1160509 RepID=A0A3N4I9A7_ASCIM|nr:kinase-like protein [Ascobolus immersus RN42]